jgi:hypothetical protein
MIDWLDLDIMGGDWLDHDYSNYFTVDGNGVVVYYPLDSPANLVPKDPCDSADPNLGSGALDPNNLDIVDFEDYCFLADNWLKEILWPVL